MLKLPVRPADSEERKDQGFTLIELLVVILIIGVLAAIAIPVFLNQREKAAEAAVKSDLKNAATVMETHYVDEQTYAGVEDASLQETDNVTVTLAEGADAAGFCLDGSSTGTTNTFFYNSETGGLGSGTCAAPVAAE